MLNKRKLLLGPRRKELPLGGDKIMEKTRYALFCEMLDALDEACQLMREYDSFPHRYGQDVLYQAESHVIQMVGKNPGITVTALASRMNKTPSACSQLVRKLREKGWISQTKNAQNNREFYLNLTEHGWIIYQNHEEFDQVCYQRNFQNLEGFTQEELQTYLNIQRRINQSFVQDIECSRADFSEIPKK